MRAVLVAGSDRLQTPDPSRRENRRGARLRHRCGYQCIRPSILLLTCALAFSGCIVPALEGYTLQQGATPTDIRYQQVLDNLAMVANNPSALPAYSSIFAGTAQVTDTAQLASATTIGPFGAGGEILSPQYTRVVLGNWTLDPINSPEKLEALRGACQWVLFGEDFARHGCPGLLDTPEEAPFPGRHFGVADRLATLPHGWVCCGSRAQVPRNACYRANCGKMWVWVMPGDTQALADFNLIVQDIARVDINSPSLQFIRDAPSDFQFPTKSLDCKACPNGPYAKTTPYVVAEVSVDRCGNLVADTPYYRWRVENVGSDASLRSQISAAGLH